MTYELGPIQRQVLFLIKEYYKDHKDKLITIDNIVVYSGLKQTTVKKAMETLSRKGRLRRISPKQGFALLV